MFVVLTRENCPYCKNFEPVVEKIAEKYESPVYYYEWGWDEDSDFLGVNVQGTPTTFIIIDGIVAKEIVGEQSFEDVTKTIDGFEIK